MNTGYRLDYTLEQLLVDLDVDNLKILDLIPAIVWMNGKDAKSVFLNKVWYEYTGSCNGSALGGNWLNYLHPDDLEPYVFHYNSSYDACEPINFEFRIRNKEGNYRWYHNTGQPQLDTSGILRGYIGTSVDIHDRKEAEVAMHKSAGYYKIFIEAMPVMAFIADKAGNIIYYNKRWYDYIGSTEGTEGWGWMYKSLHHPDDLPKTIELWNHSLTTGKPYETVYRLRRYDGEYLWHQGKALPLKDNNGMIEMWLGTNTDIHPLKQAEESLKKELSERMEMERQLHNEQELLQTIFDTIPIMLSIWDPSLNVTHLNKAVEKITGWTEDDCREKGIMELVYPDPAYRNWVAEYMQSLYPGFVDIKMITKGGQCIETSWANIRISDGRNVGIGVDISERKAFEEKLSTLSKQLHTVVDNITDGVAVYNKDGESMILNKAAKTFLSHLFEDRAIHYDRDELLLFDIEGNPVDKVNWPLYRALRGEFFDKQEYLIYNQVSKKNAYVEYSGIPVFENKEIVMAIITFNDVSLKKKVHLDLIESNSNLVSKNQELERINQLHENLLYIIAHDLRNPIGNMYLIINLLKENPKHDEMGSLLGLLNDMVKRQENIVLGLVELLQLQSVEKAQIQKIELKELVKNIIAEFDLVLVNCGAEVSLEFDDSPSITYILSFVESILRNLINNAIKYRKLDQKLMLKITGKKEDGFVIIEIEDNGIGIDLAKFQNHLFQPFKRFTRQSEGTGMGLFLIRNLIEKNGGRIEIESSLDSGTTVKCKFMEY
jgi:PAS domain S-box-containing protein